MSHHVETASLQRETLAEVRRRGARALAGRGDIRSATELLRHNGGSAPAELRGLLRDVAADKRAELRTIEAALAADCDHVVDPSLDYGVLDYCAYCPAVRNPGGAWRA